MKTFAEKTLEALIFAGFTTEAKDDLGSIQQISVRNDLGISIEEILTAEEFLVREIKEGTRTFKIYEKENLQFKLRDQAEMNTDYVVVKIK